VPAQAADATGGVDRDVAAGDPGPERVHEHVGQFGSGAVAGQVVDPDQVDDLDLGPGLLQHVADDRVDRALPVADLAAGKAPEPVSLALLAQQNAAAGSTMTAATADVSKLIVRKPKSGVNVPPRLTEQYRCF
jgi:hypothetical protein